MSMITNALNTTGMVGRKSHRGKLVAAAVVAVAAITGGLALTTHTSRSNPDEIKALSTLATQAAPAIVETMMLVGPAEAQAKEDREYEKYTINGHIQAF